MFQFQHIEHLYILALLPVFIGVFSGIVYWRKKRVQRIGDEGVVSGQILGYIPGRNTLRFILLCFAFLTLAIGWANLRMGDKTERTERKGVDVVIALDVSKSMLAKDIQPDRLTRAKQLIMSLTDKMSNDRVALVVFAGKAYMQVPLTIDYSALKMILQGVSPDDVPYQGTVISEAIQMGTEAFTQNERKYKSLIVISDGEDHDKQAEDMAKKAAGDGVVIHTVGIGSPHGATLFDPATNAAKLDENGNPVISKLNEEGLRAISRAGQGTYNLLDNTDAVAEKLNSALEGMEQKNLGSIMFTDFTSYFQYFLGVSLLLLLIEWVLPGARMGSKKRMNEQTI